MKNKPNSKKNQGEARGLTSIAQAIREHTTAYRQRAENKPKQRNWKPAVQGAGLLLGAGAISVNILLWYTTNRAVDLTNDTLVETRRATDVTERAARIDQRAWVSLAKAEMDKQPEIGKSSVITIVLRNTGKTPALGVHEETVVRLSVREPTETLLAIGAVGNAQARTMIAPNDNAFAVLHHVPSWKPEEVAKYFDGMRLYILSRIYYDDVFGKPHWLDVCLYRVHTVELDQFASCDLRNGVDIEEPKQN